MNPYIRECPICHKSAERARQIHVIQAMSERAKAAGADGVVRYTSDEIATLNTFTRRLLRESEAAGGMRKMENVEASARDAEVSVLQERVRAAREVIPLLTSELSGQMGYIEGLHQRPHGNPQRAIDRAYEVLAAITPTKEGGAQQ